jgi:hypothetical protein
VNTREQAALVVDAVATRLCEPAHAARIALGPDRSPDSAGEPRSTWNPTSLSNGYPGLALFFAELAAGDPARRPAVHAQLTATLAADAPPARARLYLGTPALGFAAHAAARAWGGYAGLLSTVDNTVLRLVRDEVGALRDRVVAGRTVGAWDGYDVINGAAGYGRYLLGRYEVTGDPDLREALTATLGALVAVALAADVTAAQATVPAWWVEHGVTADPDHGGHLNLGLAHGVAGPLALLAVALRAGVRVDGHEDALAGIVRLILAWRRHDSAGPYWPHTVTADRHGLRAAAGARIRDAWCYGAAGVGRALYLAAVAAGDAEWEREAHAALHGVRTTMSEETIHDVTLCHGWSGLLQIMLRMAQDTGDRAYARAADGLAARIVARFDPAAPFGYLHVRPGLVADQPGFLDGAAGTALALHHYAAGGPPRTGWDAALLLT